MALRASSLQATNTLAINREIDSKYDAVLAVRDKLAQIELVAGFDIEQLLADLQEAQDFTGINVVVGDVAGWDAVTKTITVPTVKGDTGAQGVQGEQGDTGPRGLTGAAGANGRDGINGRDGVDGINGIDGIDGNDLTVDQIVYNNDGTFTWMFSDGTSYETPDLRGPKGDVGEQGVKGDQGISVHHIKGTSTTNPKGDFGTSPFKDTYTFYGDANETINLGWFVVSNGFTDGMSAAVYDVNGNGIVDNSERLGGELPSHYVNTANNQAELATKINNSEKGVANGVATLNVNGKVVLTQIPDSILGQLEYVGAWNFTTMPTATQKGQYWIANVSGNGYVVGDWAVWNGVAFDKVDNTDAVASVAGRTGNVVLTKTDVGLANVDNTADNVKNVLSATKWTTARTITLSGDVAGSASVDGSANVTITTTVQPNSVALGTDTTGNYVAGATAGTGIGITGTAGEGWSPVITNTAPNVTTNISITTSTTSVTVNSSDGTDGVISSATNLAAGVMSASDKTKLDGIESGATADQTASEILTALKTVDGTGSGLDADLLDGKNSTEFALVSDTGTLADFNAAINF